MVALLTLISQLIEFYIWIIIASAVLSWLVAFDVVNLRNRYVFLFGDALNRLTEPAYRRIRRVLPNMGGLDLSPIVLIFGLMFLRNLMWEMLGPLATSSMGGY
ncbi:MAG: YggT family protein [Rhodobiaceae bacterium]|jgi:YggT family protein|nr:YggT family protein [Rhodobiaceae bacterium]